MVGAENIQHYGTKYRNQREKLSDAPINDRDRKAIKKYLDHRDANDDVGTGTLASHCNRLRLSAERADTPLVEMDEDACNAFLVRLKREYDLSDGTRRNYRKALRKFFEFTDVSWWKDLTVGTPPESNFEESKTLSMDEIQRLLNASSHPRRTALIALLADTGIRISAAAGLRVGDYGVDGRMASVQPNPDSPNKDASEPVPITWSRGQVASWLDSHPCTDDQEAPLFIKVKGVGDDPVEERFLSYQYLSKRIKQVAEEAGIERGRVKPHNFRHSAITRWIREGLSEQEIKHRAHWGKDSGQFGVYSAVSAEEMNGQILGRYGIGDEEDAPDRSLDVCSTCDTPLSGGEAFCPQCGNPLSMRAAGATEDIDEDVAVTLGNAGEDKLAAAMEFRDAFQNDAEFRAALVGED